MIRHLKKRSEKIGLPPGTLVYVGPPKTERVAVTVTQYSAITVHQHEWKTREDPLPIPDAQSIVWIHVAGLHRPEIIETIGRHYGINPLILEDVLHTGHRPKMDEYENCIFVVLGLCYPNNDSNGLPEEQIGLVLGSNYVLSFQEGERDIFESVRKRIQNPGSRFRKLGADYLAYALLDTAVDHFFSVIEWMNDRIDTTEKALLTHPSEAVRHEIHQLGEDSLALRRVSRPLKELAGKLEKLENPLINDSIRIYLRDLHDHSIQIADAMESFREMVIGLLGLYHSNVSNQMNEVMKMLTVIATIFIPLSFIAGIYGTNFKHMPELEWRWGYPLFWLIVVLIGLGMMLYFKKKKWL